MGEVSMKTQSILRTLTSATTTLVLAFFCMVSGQAVAAEGTVASVVMTPSAIYWKPHGSYAQITLTVSGPEGVTSEVFSDGVTPSYQMAGQVDGSYNYELTVTPVISGSARAALKEARATADMSAVRQMRKEGVLPARGATSQSGHFRIMKGAIFVDQSKKEG